MTEYTFSIRQRAGLQVISHALQYLADGYRDDADLMARLDASHLCWVARERILRAAAKPRIPEPRLYCAWRNPQAGVQ